MASRYPGELQHFEGTTANCDSEQEVREIFFDSDRGELRYKRANGTVVYIGNESQNHGLGTSGTIPRYITPSGFADSVITQSGVNIGIGTTTPQGELDVVGNIILSSPQQSGRCYLTYGGSASNTWGAMILRNRTNNNIVYIQAEGNSYITSGNLGIGTVTPSAVLDIVGTGATLLLGSEQRRGDIYLKGSAVGGYWDLDSDTADLSLNYEGYRSGATRFRDLEIYNGKRQRMMFFDGSTGGVGIKASGGLTVGSETVAGSGNLLVTGGNIKISSTGATGGNLIFANESGYGIKVDATTPTFGWKDLLGSIQTRAAAGGGAVAQPDYVAYNGSNIYAYRFGTLAPNNHLHEAFVEFHIPHDYVPGSDIYIHTHWSQATVDTGGGASPGVAKWMYNILYAKGHGTAGGAARGAFTGEISCSGLQQGSTTQYGHMICEHQLSAASPTAHQINSNILETDGLILVRIYRDPTDAQDTLDQDTFLHFVDIHYQSTQLSTKNKAFPFYVT